ncbi:hypothetical protein LUZ63_017604 [Rhynchospora breviuscula]|uniref:DUF676 domain-containing protein n=1 Tax=Rhynchospora breviuscula TaxID=2022672 RepID=A0A9Q0C2T2_9POAL|nr:hypothetical protein LUZ63_017604 [Rhynchospora breviuscula]
MLQRVRRLIGLDPKSPSSSRVSSAKSPSSSDRGAVFFRPPDMLETVHEIAVYIHRFHNLDLFQQGWYQLKISVRSEDTSREWHGIPARVVQYEAPEAVSEETLGVWRIDDSDNSFYTQPFRIKYARQDVYLSVMVSFNLIMGGNEGPSTSSAILKFELIYTPLLGTTIDMQDSSTTSSSAVHEFRLPHKTLLGLHSYCPVHFDIFHAVLVDLSVHIAFLKSGTKSSLKVHSLMNGSTPAMQNTGDDGALDQVLGQGWGTKTIEIVKSFLASREILLEELQKISEAVGQTVDELRNSDLTLGKYESIVASRAGVPLYNIGSSGAKKGVGQLAGILHNFLEKSDGGVDVDNDVMLYTLSKEELLDLFHSLGTQLSFVWNAFLRYHRMNRFKIVDYLHETWANDRKTEWSIWTVHSKIEIPHRYLRSGTDESSHRNSIGKMVASRKIPEDPTLAATARADLHRKSIAQMKISSRSIQDMQIFGDPSHIPVVVIEQHVMNVPQHSSSVNNSPSSSDQSETSTIVLPQPKGENNMLTKTRNPKRTGRVLRAIVFVHGFQGHHLDLRLVRNQWLLLDPGADCLMSESNEEKTSGDFREMGARLAEEVVTFLRKRIEKLTRYGGCKDIKLSFVGHSIGNIIIRTALSESVLGPYLKHLYTYMSISGPHLSYCYSSNSLFNSGLWLLKKFNKIQCIHQLTMTDETDLYNTFFYKLCKEKTLENFKNILLLSSPQDGYVPYHSARIELCHLSSYDNSKRAEVFTEMLNCCLDQFRAPTSEKRVLMRCDVNFDTSSQGRNLNTIIGRAAHIEFLETDTYAKFIMWSFPELFR